MEQIFIDFKKKSTYKKIYNTQFWSRVFRSFLALCTFFVSLSFKDTQYLTYSILIGFLVQIIMETTELIVQNRIYNSIKKRKVNRLIYRTEIEKQRKAMIEQDIILLKILLRNNNITSKEDISFFASRFEHKYLKFSNLNIWNTLTFALSVIPIFFYGEDIFIAITTVILLYAIYRLIKHLYVKYKKRIIKESMLIYFFDILKKVYFSRDNMKSNYNKNIKIKKQDRRSL